ncbi:cation channel [Desmophyllum pertusum]|uniref:Cation channel n=1 Tax=Desmophyllum pertusum TaxID=174260 RepID=A0A9W9Z1W4_9CNID|nr:cation channel [Desmophyllum pertusum]
MSLGGAAAASVLTGIVDAFKAVAQSNEVPLKTIVAALLLLGVKEFLNDIIFSCPEENFAIYGSLFIGGPSIFLFCLSLLASSAFWQAVTGCCLLRCRGKKLLLLKAKNTVFVACLAPVIWLIYAFVEEDYYVCAKLGPLDAALAKANTAALKDAVNKEFSQTKTESQFIAWGMVLGLVVFSTIFVTIYRLCLPIDPKLQGEYAFQEYEADKAVALFNEKVKPLAEQDAKQLIDSLFEKYKYKNHVEQIRVIEDQLKKMFPRHAGKLQGPIRVKHSSIRPGDIEMQPV